MYYHEPHRTHRSGWLRAAVMGANDGIVSTASLIIGVASAGSSGETILLAGVAGMVAGAMSMAAGEYVSVSSQADIEAADLTIESKALSLHPEEEQLELAHIYEERGLEPALATQVAQQLMAHDALGAHARDEIGISENVRAQPILAALSSATTFSIGAFLPLLATMLLPHALISQGVALSSLVFLAMLGSLSAHVGGAAKLKASLRVCFWGALAMALTYAVGTLFNIVV
jgi:vacuolar iron transporter family protein